MPLDVSSIATSQIIQATHVTQYYNLLTGAMQDQVVNLKHQVNVGGGNTITAATVPLIVSGVAGQTADLFDAKSSTGTVLFGVSAAGAISLAGGLTVTAGGINITGASTFASGGVTVQAGGITVTAGGLTVSAGNLAVSTGVVGIGVAPNANYTLSVGSATGVPATAHTAVFGGPVAINGGATGTAQTGDLRMASTRLVAWRNAGGGADITLTFGASDVLTITGAGATAAGGSHANNTVDIPITYNGSTYYLRGYV